MAITKKAKRLAYAREWAEGLHGDKFDFRHGTRGNKELGHYIDIHANNIYIGRILYYPDGTAEWQAWEHGSGWSYTSPIDNWAPVSNE